jgi:hypothetical protein
MNSSDINFSQGMSRIQENKASPTRRTDSRLATGDTADCQSALLRQRVPQFGEDYDIGWIFFTDRRGLLSDGIAWFERFAEEEVRSASERGQGQRSAPSLPVVTHTGVCVNENAVIQAHFDTGVAQGTVADLLEGPVYFQRPAGWSVTRGVGIAASAARQLGRRYNTPLILTQALANTFAGRLINGLFRNAPNRWLSKRLGERNAFICSQLVAFALNEQPWLKGRGVLAMDNDLISPQMLFDDPEILET